MNESTGARRGDTECYECGASNPVPFQCPLCDGSLDPEGCDSCALKCGVCTGDGICTEVVCCTRCARTKKPPLIHPDIEEAYPGEICWNEFVADDHPLVCGSHYQKIDDERVWRQLDMARKKKESRRRELSFTCSNTECALNNEYTGLCDRCNRVTCHDCLLRLDYDVSVISLCTDCNDDRTS
jgi:hypothetical protein